MESRDQFCSNGEKRILQFYTFNEQLNYAVPTVTTGTYTNSFLKSMLSMFYFDPILQNLYFTA